MQAIVGALPMAEVSVGRATDCIRDMVFSITCS
jgi:hypothetical protein